MDSMIDRFGMTAEERAASLQKGREARKEKLASWQSLHLRQQWADEHFMRDTLVRYGVKAPNAQEPATAERVLQLCRRAGLTGADVSAAIGNLECRTIKEDVDKFIKMNDNERLGAMPLWAAVSMVLEMKGGVV